MKRAISIEAPNTAPVPMSMGSLKKVGIVWVLISLVFAAFHFFYLPRYRQQALQQPEAFVEYAAEREASGDPAQARTALLRGIHSFNPPCEMPYRSLARVEKTLGNPQAAALASLRARFYEELEKKSPVGLDSLGQQVLSERIFPAQAPSLVPPRILSEAWRSFEFSIGVQLPQDVSPEMAWGLLSLAGGALSGNGQVGRTGIAAPLPLLAYSGGGMDERRGVHLFVGEREYAEKRRGMHVVLIDTVSGGVLDAGVFDLWESSREAERLLEFLETAPEACIGLFAVCDDGAASMTSATENGLLLFGMDRFMMEDRKPRVLGIRASFAAIGVKGAAPGTALQAWSPEWFGEYRGHPVVCAVSGTGAH